MIAGMDDFGRGLAVAARREAIADDARDGAIEAGVPFSPASPRMVRVTLSRSLPEFSSHEGYDGITTKPVT